MIWRELGPNVQRGKTERKYHISYLKHPTYGHLFHTIALCSSCRWKGNMYLRPKNKIIHPTIWVYTESENLAYFWNKVSNTFYIYQIFLQYCRWRYKLRTQVQTKWEQLLHGRYVSKQSVNKAVHFMLDRCLLSQCGASTWPVPLKN